MSTMKFGKSKATPAALDALLKGSPIVKRLNVKIPEDLHKQFKMACLQQDVEMSEVTLQLIQQWIKGSVK